jgi:hypothetical protein
MPTGELALIAWPIVAIFLFRKLPLQQAVIWCVLGGYLLLPSARSVGWDLPALPPVDKALIPAVCAAVGATLTLYLQKRSQRFHRPGSQALQFDNGLILRGWLPRSWILMTLLAMGFLATVMTALTNGDTIVWGPTVLPPLSARDSISMTTTLLIFLLPALLGRKYLSDDRGHRLLLIAFCLAALAYSFLAIYESRMSPQLNRMVYGFFPHSWIQHIRGGGFRPLVFLDHGLLLGIFLAISSLGTATLIRVDAERRLLWVMALLWLLGTLVLSRNLGALLFTIMMLPVVMFFSARVQLLVAALVAVLVMTYPALRGTGQIPTDQLVATASQISAERAGSLQFRFDNEDVLLARAEERPLYGWGGFKRSRVFNERGRDITVADGAWVIMIGRNGWLGYAAIFGLLGMPLVMLAIWRKRYHVGLVTAGLGMAQAVNLLDLLPNASITPVLWLVSGALMGRLETQTVQDAPKVEAASEGRLARRYSRFEHTDGTPPHVRNRSAANKAAVRSQAPQEARSSSARG